MLQRVLTLALMVCSLAAPVRALDPSTRLSHYVRTVWTSARPRVWSHRAITQDRDRYLWLRTDAGLIRFDGVRFVHIDEPQLKTAKLERCCASDGSLWSARLPRRS
jgi:ligand-binding sensor domain-containing protein